MSSIAKIGIAFLSALIGYVVGAFGGGTIVSYLSQNRHDKSVEAAMTGAFVTGPILAIIVFIIIYWIVNKH